MPDVRSTIADRKRLWTERAPLQSAEEHLRAELIELAKRPSLQVLLARIRERKVSSGTKLPARKILAHRDRERR